MHICADCPYTVVPRSFDKFVEKIYAQHYFSVLKSCDDFVNPLEHKAQLLDWENLQAADCVKKIGKLAASSMSPQPGVDKSLDSGSANAYTKTTKKKRNVQLLGRC